MPELPEVEIHARRAREWLLGKRIDTWEVLDPKLVPVEERRVWEAHVPGHRVTSVGRLAKYLFLELESDHTLVLHLRMTGKLKLDSYVAGVPPKHTRLALDLETGERLRFEDARRFGRAWLVPSNEVLELPELRGIGPDALAEPTSTERLTALCRGSRRPIKALLMDQRAIGGLGNICAIEVLFRTGIAPDAPAGSLTEAQIAAICREIPPYLEWAIHAQGRRDLIYLGEPGAQNVFSVYARAGEPCPRCGVPIRRTVLAGRGTFSCPQCQPAVDCALALARLKAARPTSPGS